jgi:adenylate cyclase
MKRKLTVLFLGLIITGLIFILTWEQAYKEVVLLPRFNQALYDLNLKFFYFHQKPKNVVVVDVDEKSIRQEGKWPWSRDKLAVLANNLQKAGASVVAFDVLFPEADYNPAALVLSHLTDRASNQAVINYLNAHLEDFDNDQAFAHALAQGDSVLGVFFRHDGPSKGVVATPPTIIGPIAELPIPKMEYYTGAIDTLMKAAKHSGFVTTIPDSDGIIRRSPLLLVHEGIAYPSLALETARVYFLQDKIELVTEQSGSDKVLLGIKLGSTYIPSDSSGGMLIPYHGPSFSFPYVSAGDILHDNFDQQLFSGKVAIVGSSAIGIGDMHSSPLEATSYPGCEMHANMIESIIAHEFLSSPLWMIGLERVLIVLMGLAFSIIVIYCRLAGVLIATILAEIIAFILQGILWIEFNLVLPHAILPYIQILMLGIANIAYGYFFETRLRRKIHDTYGQYVSAEHIDSILLNPKKYTLEGKTKEMTVLFADVRGFTSIAEKMNASVVKHFLNQLFTPLTEIIFEFKGTIDKYVGDMVMAFWNDPIEDPNHPQRGVEAALKMTKRVKELAGKFTEQNIHNVRVGIGVNTGIMHVGDMGSQYRKAYTVLGDEVNLTARLESANKIYDTNVLVTEFTKSRCQGIVFRFIDNVRVKGKERKVVVYEPLCLVSELTKELENELQLYQAGIERYHGCQFAEAKKIFSDLAAQYPEIELYRIYLARTEELICSPPPTDWDWVFVTKEK